MEGGSSRVAPNLGAGGQVCLDTISEVTEEDEVAMPHVHWNSADFPSYDLYSKHFSEGANFPDEDKTMISALTEEAVKPGLVAMGVTFQNLSLHFKKTASDGLGSVSSTGSADTCQLDGVKTSLIKIACKFSKLPVTDTKSQ